MLEQLKNSIDNEPFEKKEKLFRAVRSWQWKNGRPSSSAFKLREQRNEKELSFDRQKKRSEEECIAFMRQNLSGNIVSVKVEECHSLNLTVIASPHHTSNPYHTSVFENTPGYVSDEVAFDLAMIATTEYLE